MMYSLDKPNNCLQFFHQEKSTAPLQYLAECSLSLYKNQIHKIPKSLDAINTSQLPRAFNLVKTHLDGYKSSQDCHFEVLAFNCQKNRKACKTKCQLTTLFWFSRKFFADTDTYISVPTAITCMTKTCGLTNRQ